MTFIQKTNEIYLQLGTLLNLNPASIEDNITIVSNVQTDVTSKYDEIVAMSEEVNIKNSEVKNLNVEVLSLAMGESPSIDYNSSTGKLTLGIPRGDRGEVGDRGEAFKVSFFGLNADKAAYNTAPRYSSFLAVDTSTLYFKLSDTDEDWSAGVSFGKGDDGRDGDSLTISSIDDNGDSTFTWHFSDGTDYLTSNLKGDTGDVGETPAHELVGDSAIRFKNPDNTWGSEINLISNISNSNVLINISVAPNTNKAVINPLVFDTLSIGNGGVLKFI